MSYDYMLGKGDAAMGLEEFMESAAGGVIGSAEMLKASITGLFPSVRWEESKVNVSALPFAPEGMADVSWFGRSGPPEFHFFTEQDGQVRLLSMSRCERSEVELVARTLELVAIDQQTMEVFGG